MGLVYFPFSTTHSALAYYNFQKPGRLKALDLEEGSRGLSERHTQYAPEDLFAAVLCGIHDTLKHFPKQQQQVFAAYHLGARYGKHEIAAMYGVSTKTVSRYIERIEDALEEEFRLRELLPPLDEKILA